MQRAIRYDTKGTDNEQLTTVAVITGASQGIGAGLVPAYRKLGYAVVANSRTIGESDDPMVLTVPGDIAQPGVGQRVVDAALDSGSAGSTRWSTTPASSSPSRSPSTPTTTTTPSPA